MGHSVRTVLISWAILSSWAILTTSFARPFARTDCRALRWAGERFSSNFSTSSGFLACQPDVEFASYSTSTQHHAFRWMVISQVNSFELLILASYIILSRRRLSASQETRKSALLQRIVWIAQSCYTLLVISDRLWELGWMPDERTAWVVTSRFALRQHRGAIAMSYTFGFCAILSYIE